ncbi:Pectin acetylesterase 5 [Vitis vinifera]|uniref:Pectin acetylesterase n=1 Tax=Vitis vinifera TaxID=29760 RepID=A0A438DE95_VITVI|nr:Pectin acetylesterase 5 [Vitis vinifera]
MANPRLRLLLPWRKFSKRDWAIAAFGFTIFFFALSFTSTKTIAPLDLVDLTLVRHAKDKGAGIVSDLSDFTQFSSTFFCLDGSAPGYHFRSGFGSGSNNWVLHIESCALLVELIPHYLGIQNLVLQHHSQLNLILVTNLNISPDLSHETAELSSFSRRKFVNLARVKASSGIRLDKYFSSPECIAISMRPCLSCLLQGHRASSSGGGWCNTVASCLIRKTTALGSSNYMERQVRFSGILSHDSSQNPGKFYPATMHGLFFSSISHVLFYFFDWNKVKLRYCDGASFAGNSQKNETQLFFRGQRIWEAVMDELLSIGLSNAKQVLLSGCSAGGLATLIHCDDFRGILPKDATVKCLADAGFFLDEKDVTGNRRIRSFYSDVVHLQGVASSLDKDCVGRMEPSQAGFLLIADCFFPQEFIKNIKTPVFLVNPAYDFWQIQHVLIPAESDPSGKWAKCRLSIQKCSPAQIEILHGFRNSMLKTLSEFQQNKDGGMFINSCFSHCQTLMTETWHSPYSPRINNKTIAESVGDWYFNRKLVKQIDCPYPCNPTCYNMDFTWHR